MKHDLATLPTIQEPIHFRFSADHFQVSSGGGADEPPGLSPLALAAVPRGALVVMVRDEPEDAAWSSRLSARLGLVRIDESYVGVDASGFVSVTTIEGQRFLELVPENGVRALRVRKGVAEPFILGSDGMGSPWTQRDLIPERWRWLERHAPRSAPLPDFNCQPFKVRSQLDIDGYRMQFLDIDPGVWIAANPFFYFIPRLIDEDYYEATAAVRALAEGRALTPFESRCLEATARDTIVKIDDMYALHEEADAQSAHCSSKRFASVNALSEAVAQHQASTADDQ